MAKTSTHNSRVLTGIVIALLMSCSPAERSDRSTTTGGTPRAITIGVLAPKTGFMSGHGNSIDMGARLAEAELNAHGGINGTPVKVVSLDTTSEPAGAADRARELIQRFNARLLIGTGTSASTLAVIPINTSARVPFIYSLDGECKTCVAGSPQTASQYVWGSGFTERMAVRPMLVYLGGRFQKAGNSFRIYFIGGDYVYPRTTNAYARSVAEELGFKIVGDEYSDTSTRDYTPVIRRILAAKPDLLIVTNPGASGVTFMRQALQLGLNTKVAISGFATFDQEAVDAMGAASEGVYCVNRYSNELQNSANAAFLAAFRKMYPDKPLLPGPTAAAGAYGAILVAARAFEKAGSTEPDRFYAAMRGLEMDLPQGHVIVDPSNNIFQQPMYIMQIRGQKYHVVTDLGLQKHPGLEGCSVQ
jgi:ABC-type branched-subunit amino acid transport system substrate-binding protein